MFFIKLGFNKLHYFITDKSETLQNQEMLRKRLTSDMEY